MRRFVSLVRLEPKWWRHLALVLELELVLELKLVLVLLLVLVLMLMLLLMMMLILMLLLMMMLMLMLLMLWATLHDASAARSLAAVLKMSGGRPGPESPRIAGPGNEKYAL